MNNKKKPLAGAIPFGVRSKGLTSIIYWLKFILQLIINMKFEYSILTPAEQVNSLENKWLAIDIPKEDAIHFLTHHNYFQLMMYFRKYRDWDKETKNHIFNKWTKISAIIADYTFDYELKHILFRYMTHIENSFKNNFCQIMCQKHWNVWWADHTFFKTKRLKDCFYDLLQPHVNDIWAKKHWKTKHYRIKYTEPKVPPFWNMIEILSFGQTSKVFNSLEDQDVVKTISGIYGFNDEVFHSILKVNVDIRNTCCHHWKIFDNTDIQIKQVKKLKTVFDGQYTWTYAICSLVRYMLKSLHEQEYLKEDIRILLDKYPTVDTKFPEDREELWM